ncbi:FG-GAP-like repeat-containing protein [Azospirillum argentinense]
MATIYGDYNSNTLHGTDENNLIDGGLGNDLITGGGGNDTIYGGHGNDYLYGDAGDDLLDGGEWHDTVYGGNGNDTLSGGNGNDYLSGDAGNDLLSGGDGYDTLHGGDGNDTLYGGGLADSLFGGDGNDVMYGGVSNDTLYGGNGNDSLYGEDGNDYLDGDHGDDLLDGGAGNDTLNATSGNDTLIGGAGYDILWGGTGNDVFRFSPGSGQDAIEYTGDGFDVVELIHNPGTKVTLFRNLNDLQISVGADTIIVRSHFQSPQYAVEGLRLLNGPTLNLVAATQGLANGTSKTLTLTTAWNGPDLNGDGKADVLLRNATTGQFNLWSAQSWSATSIAMDVKQLNLAFAPNCVVSSLGDFDGDGRTDILWRDTQTGSTGISFMNGMSVESSFQISGSATGWLSMSWKVSVTADFNKDGKTDILWRDIETGDVRIWMMHGSQLVNSAIIQNIGLNWALVGAADMDGDGASDLIWQDETGTTAVWSMNGSTISTQYYLNFSLGKSKKIVDIRDIDSDGKADIIYRDALTGEVSLLIMNGSNVVRQSSLGVRSSQFAIENVADYDGDGRSDILWRDQQSGTVDMWRLTNNGAGLAAQQLSVKQSNSNQSINISGMETVSAAGAFNGIGRITKIWGSDFDGNGTDDILMRSNLSGKFSIWSMQNLTFSIVAKDSIQAPQNCTVSSLDDFDGDGRTDILWRDGTNGNISITFMSGSTIVSHLTLSGSATASFGLNWKVSATADFDGDGKADILWRDSQTGAVSLWRMNGAKVVQDTTFEVGLDWTVVGAADMDGDGKSDILWRSHTGLTAVWKMNGAIALQGNQTNWQLDFSWQVAGLSDMDGDGKADILWRNCATQEVAVWTMDGSTATTGRFLGTMSERFVIESFGDYNGDGRSDILWRDQTTGNVEVWRSVNENGYVSVQKTPIDTVNAVGMDSVNKAASLAGAGRKQENIWRSPDLNGDRVSEVFLHNTITGEFGFWNLKPTLMGTSLNVNNQIGCTPNRIGDFDGDGKTDVLWRNSSDGTIHVMFMDGPSIRGCGASFNQLGTEWEIAATADFDGDGKTDILWRNMATGHVRLWQMDGLNIYKDTIIDQVDLSWTIVGAGDMTGDGRADIVWKNTNESIVLWQMDGATPLLMSQTTTQPSIGWKIVGLGDMNGDGKTDLLWQSETYERIGIWGMDGFETTITTSMSMSDLFISNDFSIAGVGDYTGDGRDDVLWRNTVTGGISLSASQTQNGTIVLGGSIELANATGWHIVSNSGLTG